MEGLSFSVSICAITEACHLCTSTDYFNRNNLFSSNRYLANIWIIIPWAYLSCMLMDYANVYANIIYYHHMLVYLNCWVEVVGIKLWVACSTVVFIECLEEVGSLYFPVGIYIYISYLGLELISAVILSIVVYTKYNILNQLANIKVDATLLDMVVVPEQHRQLKQFM